MEQEQESQGQPALSGQLGAMWRQGLKDLHNAIVPAFPTSAHTQDEPGTPLAPTPQMVTQDLNQGYDALLESYSSRAQPEPEPQKEVER